MFRTAMGHFPVHFLGYSLNLERKAPEDRKRRLPELFRQAACAFLFIFCRYPTPAMKPLIFCAASFFMPAVTCVNTDSVTFSPVGAGVL